MGEAKRRNKKPSPFRGKGKFAFIIIITAVAIVGVFDFYRLSKNPPLTRLVPARTIGPENAKFQVIEFIDFQCQDCARGKRILKRLMEQHSDDIRLSLKYFPLEEPNSMAGAIHAECAAQQDLFWAYHDELIAKQNQWRHIKDVNPFLLALARNIKIDTDQFQQCVGDEGTRVIVEHEKRLGDTYFVKSVPTYFINQKMFVGAEEMQNYFDVYYENKKLGI